MLSENISGGVMLHTSTNERFPNRKAISPIVTKLGDFTIPSNILDIFNISRYYFITDKIINANIKKLAVYPITKVNVNCNDNKTKNNLKEILYDGLRIREVLTNSGIQFYIHGNDYIGFLYPFQRQLKCPNCKNTQVLDEDMKTWDLQSGSLKIKCEKCKHQSTAKVVDLPLNRVMPRLIHWSVFEVIPDYNKYSGKTIFYKYITDEEKRKIKDKNVDFLRTCPLPLLELYRKRNRLIVLNSDTQFHFKNFTLADTWPSFGFPPLLPLFISLYYIGLLQKANEAIAHEFMVPLRFIVPSDALAAGGAPNVSIQLGVWESVIKSHINAWKKDPLHIGFIPLPANLIYFSGEGRQLLSTDHIKMEIDDLIAGMGAPAGFFRGILNWTGQSISQRMLENLFINYRIGINEFLNVFLLPKLRNIYNIPKDIEVKLELAKFKMADDALLRQSLMNLNSTNKVSDDTLLSQGFDIDPKIERDKIKQELQAALELRLYQNELQEELKHSMQKFEEMNQEDSMVDMDKTIDSWMSDLSRMSPGARNNYLAYMKDKSPQSYELLMSRQKAIQEREHDMPDPLPEQRAGKRKMPVV